MTQLRHRTIGEYVDSLASPTPAPGGGSVAGLVGALAAALGQMVANITVQSAPNPTLSTAAANLARSMESLLAAAEQDETCFPGYLAASRLPKSTEDEKANRRQAMQEAIIFAAEVPLTLATHAADVLDLLEPVAHEGTAHAASDTAIGINLAEAAAIAALSNVRANIPLIKHQESVSHFTSAATALEARATAQATRLRDILANR